MRPIKLCLVLAAACISFEYADAQASDKTKRTIGVKTASVRVASVCPQCKKKLENTAYTVQGIKSAEWNEDTQLLTLRYDVFKKDAVDQVQRKIADAGYNTEKYPAANTVVQHGCCCHATGKASS